jgi:uncharacterized membrane protein YphA (DoxX/SURF4 family)
MRKAAARSTTNFKSGHSVLRLLIVSYFMTLAIGLIPGTDITVLADPFMPWISARILTGTIVFTLASLILVGIQRRAAALLLAIVLFWASYIVMLSAEGAHNIAGFWRDLALIGALILTYADTENATQNDAAAVLSYLPNGTSEGGRTPISASRLLQSYAVSKVRGATKRKSSKAQFVEDLNHVRAS